MNCDDLALHMGDIYKERLSLDFPCKIYPEMYPLIDVLFHCSISLDSEKNRYPFLLYGIMSCI